MEIKTSVPSKKTTAITTSVQPKSFSGIKTSVPKKIDLTKFYDDGVTQRFDSAADASLFGGKMGLKDTLNGVIQLIPGDIGEASIAKDWKRLEYAMEEYGAPVVTAFFGGLIADPIGLAIPISKLRIPGKILKYGEKYLKKGDKVQDAQTALKGKDYAQVAAGGALVGALGYTPGEVGSEDWIKGKAIQTGLGATISPAILGAGKGVRNAWTGGKNKRFGTYDSPMVGPKPKDYNPVNDPTAIAKTMGERGWEKFSNSPKASLGTVGAGLGGFAAYNSGVGEDFTDKTLRDWFGDDEPRDWQKYVNAVGGVIAGGMGVRKVAKANPDAIGRFFMKGYGQTDSYKSAKQARRGAEHMIMEGTVLPLAAKLEKLNVPDRELLFKMVTQEDLGDAAGEVVKRLDPLKKEINDTVFKLGRELVDAGILSEKVWLRNKDKYLHRLYKKPGKADTAFGGGGFGFIADEVRMRGNKIKVNIADWRTGKYDIGGSRNKEGYEWQEFEHTEKGAGVENWSKWKQERADAIKNNSSELSDLYRRAYEPLGLNKTKEEIRKLSASERKSFDAAKKKVRAQVKDEFMPYHLNSKMEPSATVEIRRDWTKAEREDMGEVTDILDTFLATGKLLAYDGATAKMLKSLTRTDSSPELNKAMKHTVQIPKTKENLKKYGPLAGKFVSEDLIYDMKHFNGDAGVNKLTSNKLFRIYRKFNAWWKGTKTVGNPAVHMGNFTSNLQHYDHAMAGYGFKEKWGFLGQAMRELNAWKPGTGKGLDVKGSDLNEATSRGLLDATLISGELREEGLAAVKRILARESTLMEKLQDSDVSLVAASARITKKLWDKTGKPVIEKASQLYQYEDNVFRYALFKAETKRLTDLGLDRESAMNAATRKGREWFVDYADVPPALGWARETGLPFLSYSYGIIPKLAETAMKHPMKIAKWAAIGHIANEAGWALSDNEDREEVERLMEAQSLGFDSMFGIPGTSPTKIKNPDHLMKFFGKDQGFWDISRIYTGGDLFDAREGGAGQIKILPGMVQPSFGAAGAVGWSLMSIDQFKGKTIPEGKKIAAFYKQMVPNLAFIPNTYANDKLKRALSGKEGETIDVHTPLSALASSIGLKIVPVSKNKLEYRAGAKLNNRIRELKTEITRTAREYEKGTYHSLASKAWGSASGKSQKELDKIADKAMEKDIESIVRSIERLVKDYENKVNG